MRGQRSGAKSLERYKALFEPRSMAVIGVSSHNERHPANVIFNKNRMHYSPRVFAVNPSGGMLHGEPLYPKVSDIQEKVDLAVIAVRSEQVRGVIEDCIGAGVGAGVVISAGFAEVGRADLQEEIANVARQAGFPFLGPNCVGLFSPPYVDTNFIASERTVIPKRGNIALMSQSGGVLVDQMIKLTEGGAGLSRAVSIGNKALIRELNLLDYFIQDDQTKVIAFYVEGFDKGEGRAFLEKAAKSTKPIVVLKSGKSQWGTQAVSSHSASLAGDYRVFSAALAQYGVVEARNETELVNFCEALSSYRTHIEGKVGIVTGSGGHGVMTVDFCSSLGLTVPGLPADAQEELRSKIGSSVRAIASLNNPFDLTGTATDDDFVAATTYLLSRPEIDCLIVLLLPAMPGVSMDLGAKLSMAAKQKDKVLIAYVPRVEKYRILTEGFELNGVPVARTVEGAVLMAEAMRRWGRC